MYLRYKSKACARKEVGVQSQQGRSRKKLSLSRHAQQKVLVFFKRDDISTLTTGKEPLQDRR